MRTRRARVLLALSTAIVLAATTAGVASAVGGHGGPRSIHVKLTGWEEDPLALSTTGNGRFSAQIDERAQEIRYSLSYAGLEGSVTQAHIHIGGRAQSGGISVFLCSNLGNGPAGTQACPAAPARVEGTIRAADVIGPTAQGVTAGQFNELLNAIRAETTYVNVHSSLYPGGEIRSQLDNQKLSRHHH
jgi:hypothetical protein